jgi:hypothetical protein
MREVNTHKVEGDKVQQVSITVLDEPGNGNACHKYSIALPNLEETIISFQNGPIKEVGVNGLTHESLLAVVLDRLESFQAGDYACHENAMALTYITKGLEVLQLRTMRRLGLGIEGTSIDDEFAEFINHETKPAVEEISSGEEEPTEENTAPDISEEGNIPTAGVAEALQILSGSTNDK